METHLTLRLSPHLHRTLKAQAKVERRSLNALIVDMLHDNHLSCLRSTPPEFRCPTFAEWKEYHKIAQRAADPARLLTHATERKPCMKDALYDFVRESNRIEGITREPRQAELDAHAKILAAEMLTVSLLKDFVSVVQPGAVLRDRENLNVRVGRHVAPQGGPMIAEKLTMLLLHATRTPLITNPFSPDQAYRIHREYEHLHPFTDGNGRSGRAVWLYMIGGVDRVPLGFLHTWYYQSLNEGK